jgi:hypothetical protein
MAIHGDKMPKLAVTHVFAFQIAAPPGGMRTTGSPFLLPLTGAMTRDIFSGSVHWFGSSKLRQAGIKEALMVLSPIHVMFRSACITLIGFGVGLYTSMYAQMKSPPLLSPQ